MRAPGFRGVELEGGADKQTITYDRIGDGREIRGEVIRHII